MSKYPQSNDDAVATDMTVNSSSQNSTPWKKNVENLITNSSITEKNWSTPYNQIRLTKGIWFKNSKLSADSILFHKNI